MSRCCLAEDFRKQIQGVEVSQTASGVIGSSAAIALCAFHAAFAARNPFSMRSFHDLFCTIAASVALLSGVAKNPLISMSTIRLKPACFRSIGVVLEHNGICFGIDEVSEHDDGLVKWLD